MGMSASQARLLTITARLADNELRSQTINNAKMRLATESSQASEAYVNALNATTMRFSNYDLEGASQNQALTFNSLTSYSAYNTQYGLVDNNNLLLVSEDEAKLFKSANGDLDKFLESHGLEYSTTYFTDECFGVCDDDAWRQELLGQVDGIDKILPEDFTSDELSVEKLEEYYLEHLSYESSQELQDFQNYATALGNVPATYNFSYDTTGNTVYNFIVNHILSDKYVDLTGNADAEDYNKALQYLSDFYAKYKDAFDSTEQANLDAWLKKDEGTEVIHYVDETADPLVVDYKTTIYTFGDSASNHYVANDGSSYKWDTTSPTTATTDEGKKSNLESYYENIVKYITEHIADKDNIKSNTDLYSYLHCDNVTEKASSTAWDTQFEKLMKFVFGDDYENYNNMGSAASNDDDDLYKTLGGTVDTIFEKLLEYIHENNIVNESSSSSNGMTYTDEFLSVIKSYLVDSMVAAYGEPKYSWIDSDDPGNTNNPNAKAQWYTNLFNRMCEGYTTIEDGLASSNGWIEYALEAGIVSFEQVDNNYSWQNLDYKTCTRITEESVDSDVTKAEAEYNRAMNDIEAKDNIYDIQLKNIDTEHTALNQEYDSIKSVIEKNIERVFKFDQSA